MRSTLAVASYVIVAVMFPATVSADNGVTVTHLRCEYRTNPLGIDVAHPRLSWVLESGQRGQIQKAYRVLVASSVNQLAADQGDLWDSGKVRSDQSIHIEYAGKPLASRQQAYWKVCVWDSAAKPCNWSEPATWQMGILNSSDWKGQWIASDIPLHDYQAELKKLPDFEMHPKETIWQKAKKIRKITAKEREAPAVWMRKEFQAVKPIQRATAYVCGLGLHELYLNGHRITDTYLNPAQTDYQKRCLYMSYDVTSAMREGDNTLGVILGNGWFNLITPHLLRFYAADYINPPQLRLDMDIEYEDGTHEFIASDKTWRFTTDGPIRFNCILAGETYDARRELGDWSRSGYDDTGWKQTRIVEAPAGKLVSQQLADVKVLKEIPAKSVEKIEGGYRFDLGEDSTGWARLHVRGKRGDRIKICYPGVGSHTLGRYQTCEYICQGSGFEVYEPRFCYNGYRYVDVYGLNYKPSPHALTGKLINTDLPFVGGFECSNDKLTRLQDIVVRTIRNYIVHIPNDPVREKCGWTEDVLTGFEVNAYNFDTANMYAKWQQDHVDAIQKDGYVPPVVPSRFDGLNINGPWWGGMIVYTPWQLYKTYGDRRILAESYQAMKLYLSYLDSIAKDHIITWGLGDWLDVGSVNLPVLTPVELTSTAGYYLHATILAQTAEILGLPAEAAQFAERAERIRQAYHQRFFDAKTGDYSSGSQAALILSLRLGLVPDDRRGTVIDRLIERIGKDHNHLSTGFVATPYLLTTLSGIGRGELAYTIATQETFPGWFDMVFNKGNTVLKENWEGTKVQMPSLAGPIGGWFYYSLAGIRQEPDSVGFKKIVIKPDLVGDLTWVKAHYDTLYGRVISHWQLQNETLTMEVTIPPNTTATIYVPTSDAEGVTESGVPIARAKCVRLLRIDPAPNLTDNRPCAVFEIGSGRYRFKAPFRSL